MKMEVNKELFVMLAKILSEEEVVERLKTSIEEYQEARLLNKDLDSAKDNLKLSLHLTILNFMDDGPMDIIKQMDKVNQRVKFFEQGEKN